MENNALDKMKEATELVEVDGNKMVRNPARVFKIFLSVPAGKERMDIMKEYNEWLQTQ